MSLESLKFNVHLNQTEKPIQASFFSNYRQSLSPIEDNNSFNKTKRMNISEEKNIELRSESKFKCLNIFSKEALRPSEDIKNPTSYCLINTRVFINDVRAKYDDQSITIGTIPEEVWDSLFSKYKYFYFMGVWKPSQEAEEFAKNNPYVARDVGYEIGKEVDPKKLKASPFAISEYKPNEEICPGGFDEMDKLKENFDKHGKKMIMDFVTNHLGIGCPLSKQHPEFFVQGSGEQYKDNPYLYYQVIDNKGIKYHIAHGKDPNYPQWDDTLQLNYGNPDVQEYMKNTLIEISKHCHGVRCDMANLVDYETMSRTWGDKYFGGHLNNTELIYLKNNNFYSNIIPEVKKAAKEFGCDDFKFIGEIYWDEERYRQIFDQVYDQKLRNCLCNRGHDEAGNIISITIDHNLIRDYLVNNNKKLKYTTNHDLSQSVEEYGLEGSLAAAVLTGLTPGAFMVTQGQEEGYTKRIPVQYDQSVGEKENPVTKKFYEMLLTVKNSKLCQEGEWSMIWPNANIDSRIISFKYTLGNEIYYFFTNYCDQITRGSVSEIVSGDEIEVSSLTDDKIIKSFDTKRDMGLFLELKPWEVQMVKKTIQK